MKLSPHFMLEEFVVSQEAARRGIDNTPPSKTIVDNLTRVAQALEFVRKVCDDKVIIVTSGYRCPELNKLVGGAHNSAHLMGLAADIICPTFGNARDVARAIMFSAFAMNLIDQLIYEYGRWVHIGLPAQGVAPRMQRLTIDGNGQQSGIE
jgi:zinc D-Ala-D-Ala carboxypeptidase